MHNLATSSRLNSPGKPLCVLVIGLFLTGMLPTNASAWDAKLRGKLVFAALLGVVAAATEWQLHRQDVTADAVRQTLGSHTSTLRWRNGFDRMQLENYTGGRLLLRQGRLMDVRRDGESAARTLGTMRCSHRNVEKEWRGFVPSLYSQAFISIPLHPILTRVRWQAKHCPTLSSSIPWSLLLGCSLEKWEVSP